MPFIQNLNIRQAVKAAPVRLVSVSADTFKVSIKLFAIMIVSLQILACTNLVFHPDTIIYNTPSEFGLAHRDVFLATPGHLQLHGWFLSSETEAKATVYFLHGNAQNITAHINSVYWLPKQGYHVFMIDYRGYGDSTGRPTIEGAIEDIKIGLQWVITNPLVQGKPIFLLGQSLGASLGIYCVGSNPDVKKYLAGAIFDAPFSNYRNIAREKLSDFWVTWPLQYPLSYLITGNYNPEAYIQDISPVPVLFIHSNEDKVVPASHSRRLYELAGTPKLYIETKDEHIHTFKYREYRQAVLGFMARAINRN